MVNSLLATNKFVKNTAFVAVLSMGMLSGCTALQTMSSPDDTYGVEVTDRSLAQRLLDRGIENTAMVNINRMDPTLHKRSRISVDSFFSTVLITGEVPDEQTKNEITKIVGSMPDVREFYNRLNVANAKGVSYTVHDGYITSKLNAKILANKAISTSQIKIVTDDGVVYAMGKLTPTQRSHLLNIVDSTMGIKELVLLTQLIDDSGAVIEESSIIQESGLQAPDASYNDQYATVASPMNGNGYAVASDSASVVDGQAGQAAYTEQNADVYNSGAQNAGTHTAQPTYTQTTPVVQIAPTSVGSGTTQSAQSQAQPYTQQNTTSNAQQPSSNVNSTTGGQSEPETSPYIEMYKQDVPGWQQ